MKKQFLILFLVVVCSVSLPLFAQKAALPGSSASKSRIAVFGFVNFIDDEGFDIPAETASANLSLSLRILGMYDVVDNGLVSRSMGESSLAKYCKDYSVDFVLYGKLTAVDSGGQKYALGVFDSAKGKTTVRKTAEGSSVLDVFGITDDLILSTLSSLAGRHIGFGSLRFVNSGELLDYEVVIDGTSLGKNPGTADHILTGEHVVQVFRGSGASKKEVVSQKVTISEGKTADVAFALQKNVETEIVVKEVIVQKGAIGSLVSEMIAVDGPTGGKYKANVASTGFMISRTEVTQAQYRAVTGTNPSKFTGDDSPVENVNWYDAIEYCNALSVKEGLEPVYGMSGDPWKSGSKTIWNTNANGYRLPTEDEWAFAASGGNLTNGFRYAGSDKPDEVAWYVDDSMNRTQPVGGKKANELGLYDMSGNVSEWCWVSVRLAGKIPPAFYGQFWELPHDEPGPIDFSSNTGCAMRGGSWEDSGDARLAVDYQYRRKDARAIMRFPAMGFRVCRNR